jgi:uncharacterized protein YbjT (DUF2867 family)
MKIAVAGATGRVGRPLVEVLHEQGHDVSEISRARGVDIITGDGLAPALAGTEVIIDAATGPSPEQDAATQFFTTAARNLQDAGQRAGVGRIVVVSIIGTDRYIGGYGAAKLAHERALLSGPIPVQVVRAAQFHEFVAQLLDWGTQGETGYVPQMRTQLVAARTVAEVLVNLATSVTPPATSVEVAGPRAESLAEMATLLAARRGYPLKVEAISDPADPNRGLNENGGLLPGPDAILAGPTFPEWLDRGQ